MRILIKLFALVLLASFAEAVGTPTATATATATPTPTATLTLNQIKNKVDNKLAAVYPTAQAREFTYIVNNGRYWQGVAWCSTPPDDGADAVVDYTVRPSYQAENWLNLFPALNGTTQPMCLSIDTYNGPHGHGFVACVFGRSQGVTYWRCQDSGNEAWRTFDWTRFISK